jgi:anaphase-promoting complex subunit 1
MDQFSGTLYGLGLLGYLNDLPNRVITEYIMKGNDITTVALLLGLSASKRSSKDSFVAKILSLHIPAILGPGIEVSATPLQQTAALLGAGLLYQSTLHRPIVAVSPFLHYVAGAVFMKSRAI